MAICRLALMKWRKDGPNAPPSLALVPMIEESSLPAPAMSLRPLARHSLLVGLVLSVIVVVGEFFSIGGVGGRRGIGSAAFARWIVRLVTAKTWWHPSAAHGSPGGQPCAAKHGYTSDRQVTPRREANTLGWLRPRPGAVCQPTIPSTTRV